MSWHLRKWILIPLLMTFLTAANVPEAVLASTSNGTTSTNTGPSTGVDIWKIAGMTPLMKTLLWYGDVDKQQVPLLLSQGADAKAMAKDGETVLHFAARARSNNFVKLLISSGADPKRRDQLGRTPLHFGLMRALIDSGIDINQADRFGQTPLHTLAAWYTHEPFHYPKDDWLSFAQLRAAYPKLILNVNARDKAGRTPLHWAVMRLRLDMTTQLIEAGADPTIKDNLGRTPTDIALMSGNQNFIQFFQSRGVQIDPNIDRFINDKNHIVNIHRAILEHSAVNRMNAAPLDKKKYDFTSFEINGNDLNNDGIVDLMVLDHTVFVKSGSVLYIYLGQEDGSFRYTSDLLAHAYTIWALPLEKGKGLLQSVEGRNYWSNHTVQLFDGFSIKPFASWTGRVEN